MSFLDSWTMYNISDSPIEITAVQRDGTTQSVNFRPQTKIEGLSDRAKASFQELALDVIAKYKG